MTGIVKKACNSCRGFSYNGTYTCDSCKEKGVPYQKTNHWTDKLYNADWERLKRHLRG